jgi:hypothetical protein
MITPARKLTFEETRTEATKRTKIDPSVALAWLLPDETNARADAIRAAIEGGEDAWIPVHWRLEVGNGLLMAGRRGAMLATFDKQLLKATAKEKIATA